MGDSRASFRVPTFALRACLPPAETQIIVLANQKGGVAKTTTTLNLGVAFAEKGFKVLLVDLDPQGNLTMSQGSTRTRSRSRCSTCSCTACRSSR